MRGHFCSKILWTALVFLLLSVSLMVVFQTTLNNKKVEKFCGDAGVCSIS